LSILKLKVPRKLQPLLLPRRYKGAYGGRGGAKSHFFAEQVISRCLQSTTRVVCIREVQNSIKDSVKQLLSDKITALGVQSYFDIVQDEIRCVKNGSIITFKGMQSYNATNIKSLEGYDVAWVEEAQTLSHGSLKLLRPTIRKEGSELWFSWNPLFKTDAVDKFFRKSGDTKEKISVFVNWNDNPWFKGTPLYKDMLADYADDPDEAEHVWGGGYGQTVGAILARWVNKARRDGRINNDIVPDTRGAPIIVSSDIGFRDTSSWWYWQPVLGGYNVLKHESDHGLDADDWIPRVRNTLKGLGCELGKIWLPHDAKNKTFQSKKSSREKFMEAFGCGKVGIVPESRKADRIEAARTTIKKCAFNETECESGIDGLMAWEFLYSEDAGTFSREPNHNWASHPSDAFSYGCQVITDAEQPKEVEPPKFWNEQTLDELWKNTRKKRANNRI